MDLIREEGQANMGRQQTYPEWFLWLAERSPFSWLSLILLVFLAVIGVACYLDSRIETQLARIERELHYRPPEGSATSGIDEALASPGRERAVYVPVYSHIYRGRGQPVLLTATLSIRNTDPKNSITITSVRYYDTSGKLLRAYLQQPLKLGPMASTEFLVENTDTAGGSGANFVVDWAGEGKINRPIIECVMVGDGERQAVSFAVRGQDITERSE